MLVMTTAWLVLRADIRRRWPALLGLALLLGLIGGVVLAAAAGARRTDTAYPRLLHWANATQADIVPEGTGFTGYYAALARLPHIAAMTTVGLYGMTLSPADPAQVTVLSSPDGRLGVNVDRVKLLAGRTFSPSVPGQAMVNQQLADLEHLAPGGTLRLFGVPNDQNGRPEYGKAVTLSYRVTAIVTFDDEIVPTGNNSSLPTALVSWPFAPPAVATGLTDGDEAAIRLQPGASLTTFTIAANALAKRYAGTQTDPGTGGNIITINLSDQVNATMSAIRPEAVALAAFAGLAGLIALAVIGQLLSRQLALEAAEFPVLRALGMRGPTLIALSLARLALVTVTGAVVAVAAAVAVSPLMPIGPARLAETDPGVEVNLAVLAAGGTVIALLPLAVLLPAARRAARQAHGPLGVAEPAEGASRPSRLAALTRAWSVTGGAGVAMAFEPGHGRTAVPVRSALAGSVIAVAALAAAVVFGASLIGLVSTPHDYGQNWVQEVDLNFGSAPLAPALQLVKTVPGITGYAAGNYGQLTIGGRIVPAFGLDQVRGTGYLTLLAGRAPAAPDEIALGAQTLRAIGGHLGQVIGVTVNQDITGGLGPSHLMRIVGIAVLPAFSRGGFSPTGLGTGAVLPAGVLSAGVASQSPTATLGCSPGVTCYNFFLLRYRPGADLTASAATITAHLLQSGCPVGSCLVAPVADQRPGDIRNYASIRDTPLALAAVLAVLAAGTLSHVLLTGVRRRRRDLAVLKTLGFTRRQLLGTVAWEASAFAGVALLVGLPVGVLAGRLAWAAFAHGAGVSSAAAVPLTTVLLVVPVTLLLANMIAAWPGLQAARLRPADVLRAE
jgi:ABC-type antimicrobial peptide transport system permease subunit